MERIELDLGEQGGKVFFSKWTDVERFLTSEREAWGWLIDDWQGELSNVKQHARSQFDTIAQQVNSHKGGENQIVNAVAQMQAMYQPENGPLVYSESNIGKALFRARELAGDVAAVFAYGIRVRIISFSQGNDLKMFLAAMIVAFPNLDDAAVIAKRLSDERNNFLRVP